VAQEELEEDPLQQVMATTSEEELSLLNLSNVATYFNQVEKEEMFRIWSKSQARTLLCC
jgi:hypothetical protein